MEVTSFSSTLRDGERKKTSQVKTLTSTLLGKGVSPLISPHCKTKVRQELIRNVMGTFVTRCVEPEVTEAVGILNTLKTDRWKKIHLHKATELDDAPPVLKSRPATAASTMTKLPGWRMQERVGRHAAKPKEAEPPKPTNKLHTLQLAANLDHTPLGEVECRTELLAATIEDTKARVLEIREDLTQHQAQDLEEAHSVNSKLRMDLITFQQEAQRKQQAIHDKYMMQLQTNDRLLEYCKATQAKASENEMSCLHASTELQTLKTELTTKVTDLQSKLENTTLSLEEVQDRERELAAERETIVTEKRRLTDRVQDLIIECRNKTRQLETAEKAFKGMEAYYVKQTTELETRLQHMSNRVRGSIAALVVDKAKSGVHKTQKLMLKVSTLRVTRRKLRHILSIMEQSMMGLYDNDAVKATVPTLQKNTKLHASMPSMYRKASKPFLLYEVPDTSISVEVSKSLFEPDSRLFRTTQHVVSNVVENLNETMRNSSFKFNDLWEKMKLNAKSGGFNGNPYKATEEMKQALYMILKSNGAAAEKIAKQTQTVLQAAVEEFALQEVLLRREDKSGAEKIAKRNKIISSLQAITNRVLKRNSDSGQMPTKAVHESFEDNVLTVLDSFKTAYRALQQEQAQYVRLDSLRAFSCNTSDKRSSVCSDKSDREGKRAPWRPSGTAQRRSIQMAADTVRFGLRFTKAVKVGKRSTMPLPQIQCDVPEDIPIVTPASWDSDDGKAREQGWIPCTENRPYSEPLRLRKKHTLLTMVDLQPDVDYVHVMLEGETQTKKAHWRDIEVLIIPERLILGCVEKNWVVHMQEKGTTKWNSGNVSLFSSAFGRWVLCEGEDNYLMQSKSVHDGILPQYITTWQLFENGGWIDCPYKAAVPACVISQQCEDVTLSSSRILFELCVTLQEAKNVLADTPSAMGFTYTPSDTDTVTFAFHAAWDPVPCDGALSFRKDWVFPPNTKRRGSAGRRSSVTFS